MDEKNIDPINGDTGNSITKNKNKRDQWSNHLEFILSTIGYSVGFGNVWRFPYVAYQNGGGAYLIPYIIMLLLVGKPIYFMELALGQYTQLGPSAAFRICPIAAGVGAAMVGISFVISIFYNVLMTYTLYFTFAGFQRRLPWTHCNNSFNTEFCYRINDFRSSNTNNSLNQNYSNIGYNITNNIIRRSSSQEYWDYGVLGKSAHLDNISNIKWDLALLLLLSWIITFGCLCKGVKSAGKVIYFTVTLPYVLLFILMIRGVTLEGAKDGILYLFTPQWNKLLDIGVWRAACSQMFFSLSVTLGGVITFSSFNSFNNNCHRDTLIISIMDTVTSLLSGIVIFSVLGYMSHSTSIPLSKVASSSGPGLVFVVYPEALSGLPIPQLWTVLFFLTLFSLGLDSIVAAIEVVLCALHDTFPKIFPWKYKTYVCLGVCCLFYLIGLTLVTEGGFYIIDIINFYVADSSLVIIGACEVIAIMWIYGYKNFIKDIEVMLGKKLPSRLYWIITWIIISPVTLTAIYCLSIFDIAKDGAVSNDGRPYPQWAHIIGWCLTALTAGMIPLIALYKYFNAPGSNFYQKWKNVIKPSQEFNNSNKLSISESIDSIILQKAQEQLLETSKC
ncbi:unnamed protein product [Gordionus sp. m RMFG-2023]|uniref:sodium- and chloride-dependent glycine transporter 2-like n=1 Tax=Gordionus sp. m RMFG-2023 TaxID=3053472 RepID=UPI0030DF348A